ncbi:serine protease [Nonomuraea endophytica]|uniref:Novel STAND NTPase 1 domain-containing protein n=1 Tax=Nonomuraea endophytica TaxID=714136 RepID=A0A7W8A0U2_9ACTN|nr:serine protease [Nonomuraea endophytica]MBB5076671.1 hypothetical protein [Nonomuraea endophytica]
MRTSAPSVAGVLGRDGRPVGAAFPVTGEHLITAAHVVSLATGVEFEPDSPPEGRVSVAFLPGGARLDAEIMLWDGARDVAVLRLGRSVDVQPAPLVDHASFDERVAMVGFPDGKEQGVWSVGVLRGAQADGWLQVDVEEGSRFDIKGGFSGTPAWHLDRGDVVGMVVAAWTGGRRSGYLIPTAQLLEAWPGLRDAVRPISPFRGLLPFGPEHAASFFGRSDEVDRISRLVVERPVVTVTGPSGVGKSSIIQAGVIPRLQGLAVAHFRPGQGRSPLHALALALSRGDPADRLTRADELARHLERGAMPELVRSVLDQLGASRLILVVDQLEEVLSAPAEQRTAFARALLHAERPNSALGVLAALRTDYLTPILRDPELAPLAAGERTINVGELSTRGLRAAVLEPIVRIPLVEYERGLAVRLLDDLGVGPGRLPLLQFTLAQLWERQSDGKLTHQAYEEIGGVREGLNRFAEQVWAELTVGEQRDAERLLIQLTRPDPEGQEITRRSAPREQLDAAQWAVAQRLAVSRLVVVDEGRRADLVHEALVTRWTRLRKLAGQAREFRLWQESLRRRIALWRRHDRRPARLLAGADLGDALRRLRERPADLSEEEREFIDLSVRRRRHVRRRRAAALAVVVAAGLAVWIPLSGAVSANAAQTLLDRAQQRAATDPYGAAQLAIRAYRTRDTPDTRKKIHDLYGGALSLTRIISDTSVGVVSFKGESRPGGSLSGKISTDGRALLTRSPDSRVVLWQLGNGAANPVTLPAEGGASANHITLSADRRYAAATYTARIEVTPYSRVPDGRCVIKVPDSPTAHLAFTVVRTCLVVTDLARMDTAFALVLPDNVVPGGVSIDPEGKSVGLVTTVAGKTGLMRWDLPTGKPLPSVPLEVGPSDSISFFRLIPGGAVLGHLVFSADAKAGKQNATGHRLLRLAFGGATTMLHESLASSIITMSGDGRRVAAFEEREKQPAFLVWDTGTGRQIARLDDMSLAESVGSPAFDATGSILHNTWLDFPVTQPSSLSLKDVQAFAAQLSDAQPVTRWSIPGGERAQQLRLPMAWRTLLPIGEDAFALVTADQIGLLLPSGGQSAADRLAAMAAQGVEVASPGVEAELAHLCRVYGELDAESDEIKKLVPDGAHTDPLCP